MGAAWVDGAIVVSNHAVVFVDRAGPDTPFNRALMTLARQQIAEVLLTEDDDMSSPAVAVIVLADGSRVTLAFGSLRGTAARPPFDLQRTQRFVDSVSHLIVDHR
jgi:hypothetical protein